MLVDSQNNFGSGRKRDERLCIGKLFGGQGECLEKNAHRI